MPTLFVGHGSPMNIVAKNQYTEGFQKIGETLPKPKAIMCISAHWLTNGTQVQVMQKPKQIYDFGGFPEELYQVKYTPDGSPQVGKSLTNWNQQILTTEDWGLDHGTWSVLHHMYPKQDIPVFQLSLDKNKNAKEHLKLAQSLQQLRSQGVLILGSGNIVHNLRQIQWDPEAAPHEWAVEYETFILDLLKDSRLTHLEKVDKMLSSKLFSISHPTPEHFLPLIYNLGLTTEGSAMSVVSKGIQNAAISMATIQG